MQGKPEAMFSGEFVRRVAATLLSSLGRGPAGFYTIAQFQFQIPAKEQKEPPAFLSERARCGMAFSWNTLGIQ